MSVPALFTPPSFNFLSSLSFASPPCPKHFYLPSPPCFTFSSPCLPIQCLLPPFLKPPSIQLSLSPLLPFLHCSLNFIHPSFSFPPPSQFHHLLTPPFTLTPPSLPPSPSHLLPLIPLPPCYPSHLLFSSIPHLLSCQFRSLKF